MKISAMLVTLIAAFIALGAQSCQVEDVNSLIYPPSAPVWFSGWLDEGKYIYWTFYASSEVHVFVEWTGYRSRSDVHLIMYLMPAEDVNRWEEGKPVRIYGFVDSENDTWDRFGIWLYVQPAYYAIVLSNRWVPDFASGDVYVTVQGTVR